MFLKTPYVPVFSVINQIVTLILSIVFERSRCGSFLCYQISAEELSVPPELSWICSSGERLLTFQALFLSRFYKWSRVAVHVLSCSTAFGAAL